MMIPPDDTDAEAWAALVPDVRPEWFVRQSSLHGVRHTQRVHIHARRLASELRRDDADTELTLCAALWHDIGRTNDGWDPRHGARSAMRAAALGLMQGISAADAEIVAFAIRCHSLADGLGEAEARRLAEQERALRILWLLKDADGLDRVRLGAWEAPDPAQLRHPQAIALLPFAKELLRVVTDRSHE